MNASGLLFLGPDALAVGGVLRNAARASHRYSFLSDGGPSLENYARFLGDPFNFRVLVNTARLGFETVARNDPARYPDRAALLAQRRARTRSVIIFLTLMPMLTSNVVRTFAWIVILGRAGPISERPAWRLGLADRRSA